MEPLAALASSGLIRPTIDLQSDLAAVLREGRVLAGEVLQTLDGGTLLIGVGHHRVPARSQVRMQPGHKFLFQVRVEGDGLVLSVLDEAGGLEPRLLRALRSAAGRSGALGQLLSELVSALGAELSGPQAATGGEAARKLVQGLAERAFRPGGDGGALARAVALGGLGYEARVVQAALVSLAPRQVSALGRELVEGLVAQLAQGAGGFDGGGLEEPLRVALWRELGASEGADPELVLARWSRGTGGQRGLRALVGAALETLGSDAVRARLLANLGRAWPEALGAGLEQVLLRALLGLHPGDGPQARDLGALLAEAQLDLKGQLLRALAELGDGPARTAVVRVLEGLENEQLLNLARARAGDALHVALPVLDGQRWTTAHLFVRTAAHEGGDERGEAEGTQRLTVAVSFLHTGPVRAELAVRPGSLAARVAVGRPEVLERMQARRSELEQRLALGGRRVSLALVLAPPEELGAERELTDIRFLREHHLMDRSC